MKNFIARGETLEITAAADVASGAGVLVGATFGVAAGDIAEGAKGIINLSGVYELPKVSAQAWVQGARIYWEAAENRCTTTVGSNTLIGVAYAAAANPSAAGQVRLNGSF